MLLAVSDGACKQASNPKNESHCCSHNTNTGFSVQHERKASAIPKEPVLSN